MSTNANGNGNGKLAWSLPEAADACSVSVPYLRKKIDSKEITPIRVGRRVLIADAELRRWLGLNGNTEEAQSAAA